MITNSANNLENNTNYQNQTRVKQSIVSNTIKNKDTTSHITIANTDIAKTSIEEAITENKTIEDDIKEQKTANKWVVNANISPVYYNTFGEGSHIDAQFNKNRKSGEINASYGLKVGYALNKKITIRSGINRLNLSYDTDDIIVYEKFNSYSSNISINDAPTNSEPNLKNVNFMSMPSGQQLSMISANTVNTMFVSTSLNAAISQRMSYFEIPLEIEYKLLDKRFGINVIGGLSTFLLNDNQVVSELNGSQTEIGEANNINPVSFSTNLGIGLNFRITKTVNFNVEPTFKYQLKTFSNTSGDFNPYIIGLYTGLNYKF
ncbi:hypothetical protein E9099_06600 [Psychroserpens sp. NJDZ02]|nr:hypothetical protein E9099_06600 [Psychroserpens sp. NJDZ02]